MRPFQSRRHLVIAGAIALYHAAVAAPIGDSFMNRATSMKLIAGVLLFGIWRGLVLANLTQAPALVDATGYASSFDRHMPITTR